GHDIGVAIAIRLRNRGRRHASERGSDEWHRVEAILRNEELRLPGDNPAFVINSSAEVDQCWRTFWIPAMLVSAHPLDAHRSPARRDGEERGVAGSIFVPVAAVTTRTFDIDAAHIVEWHIHHRRELSSQPLRPLRGAPARDLPLVNLDHSARRAD